MTAWCRSPCGTFWSSALVLLIYDTATSSSVYYLSKVLGPASLSPGHNIFSYLEEAGFLPKLVNPGDYCHTRHTIAQASVNSQPLEIS
ncbi:hypothetical protein E2C01_061953 [Portunus trituberculatus]|uniref:Uncharacterized protein n=1 Tax=Portunus trituberculatus TaxID=210409 RepID=A0A5B7HD84_PORTR|nr:hypothetical protein [Portunus trituberculatus]